jgi:hypothetical protein
MHPSPNTFGVQKSRRLERAEYVTCIGKEVLTGKTEGTGLLGDLGINREIILSRY